MFLIGWTITLLFYSHGILNCPRPRPPEPPTPKPTDPPTTTTTTTPHPCGHWICNCEPISAPSCEIVCRPNPHHCVEYCAEYPDTCGEPPDYCALYPDYCGEPSSVPPEPCFPPFCK